MLRKIWFRDDIPNEYSVVDGEYVSLKKINLFIGANNSGKSRFIRKLIQSSESDFLLSYKDYNSDYYKPDKELLSALFPHDHITINKLSYDDIKLLNKGIYSADELKKLAELASQIELLRDLNGYSNMNDFDVHRPPARINKFIASFGRKPFEGIEPSFLPNRYYLPILRGLRPVINTADSYAYSGHSDHRFWFYSIT